MRAKEGGRRWRRAVRREVLAEEVVGDCGRSYGVVAEVMLAEVRW